MIRKQFKFSKSKVAPAKEKVFQSDAELKESREWKSYRKEVETIKVYIQQVFRWLKENKKPEEVKAMFDSIKHGAVPEAPDNLESCKFPTLVECTIFMTAVQKKKAGEKVEFTYAWGDQPRVTFFRVAWAELGLPDYPVSPFHLMYSKKKIKKVI